MWAAPSPAEGGPRRGGQGCGRMVSGGGRAHRRWASSSVQGGDNNLIQAHPSACCENGMGRDVRGSADGGHTCGQRLLGGWRCWCLPLCGHTSPRTGCRNLDHRFPEVHQFWRPQRLRGQVGTVRLRSAGGLLCVLDAGIQVHQTFLCQMSLSGLCWVIEGRGLVCVSPFKAVGPSGSHWEEVHPEAVCPTGSPGRKADPGWTRDPLPGLECQCPGQDLGHP